MNHTLKVGDILKSVWGYDQTNIDYYEVIELNGQTMATIRMIGQTTTEGPNFMTGTCSPIKGKCIGEPIRKRVGMQGLVPFIKLTSYSYATPCSEKDVSNWTGYA